MSRFKVGDLVTPISVKPYSDRIQRRLLGKTLVVYSFQDNGNSFLVFAGVIGDCGFFWHQDDLRLVSETQAEPAPEPAPDVPAPERAAPEPAPEAQMPERSKLRTVNWGGCGYLNPYADTSPTNPTDPAPAAAQKPQPIRRGDLVEYQGDICVVLSKGADRDGEYYGIAPLTGTFNYYWADIDDLTRIGSIRKKIKRLKAQMESRNAT